jgi:hypothetical protein
MDTSRDTTMDCRAKIVRYDTLASPKKPAKPPKPQAITLVEYSAFQEAYSHFNDALFACTLPNVMVVLTRKARSGGHFGNDRFMARGAKQTAHELSLNPDGFIGRSGAGSIPCRANISAIVPRPTS